MTGTLYYSARYDRIVEWRVSEPRLPGWTGEAWASPSSVLYMVDGTIVSSLRILRRLGFEKVGEV